MFATELMCVNGQQTVYVNVLGLKYACTYGFRPSYWLTRYAAQSNDHSIRKNKMNSVDIIYIYNMCVVVIYSCSFNGEFARKRARRFQKS